MTPVENEDTGSCFLGAVVKSSLLCDMLQNQ